MMRKILAFAIGAGISWNSPLAAAQRCDACDGIQQCPTCCDDRGLLDVADVLLGRIHARAEHNVRRSQRDIEQLSALLHKLPGLKPRFHQVAACDDACESAGDGYVRTPRHHRGITRSIGDGAGTADSKPTYVRRQNAATAPAFPWEKARPSVQPRSEPPIVDLAPEGDAGAATDPEKNTAGAEPEAPSISTQPDRGPETSPWEGDPPAWRIRTRSGPDSDLQRRPASLPQRPATPLPDQEENPFEDDPVEATAPIPGVPQSRTEPRPFGEVFDPQARLFSSRPAAPPAGESPWATTRSSRKGSIGQPLEVPMKAVEVIPASAETERRPPSRLPLRTVRPLQNREASDR